MFHYDTALTEFKERLEDRYSRVHFHVQDPALPATGTSVRRMKFEDVAGSLLAGSSKELDNASPPLNLLNLRDFLALPEPQFLRASRFQLLPTLDARIESAVTLEDSSAGKRITTRYSDLASCSRFLLYASRGAVSGPHVDLLTGTWVQVVSGRKVWPIFTDLTIEERIEFEEQGNEWIPPREKTRVIVLDPVQDCLMHGGMFWDEMRILDTMETMSWIIQHPNVTNETIPNQLPEILFELERMMREKPERFISGGETSEGLLQKFEAAFKDAL
ncbi:histone-lysine n-methyltransferase ezh1 [Neofusicoccum parvum]|uniref:Histone-lysine n-methyltransferase ezh1 n=1 Tax=Neofusicoccum parvum TaxID=310453 RepID=A0ACB5SCA9_9PEZI|nr:histone-lysine n-methyltransferase ezh1 [Neofusicoccum parvum]